MKSLALQIFDNRNNQRNIFWQVWPIQDFVDVYYQFFLLSKYIDEISKK